MGKHTPGPWHWVNPNSDEPRQSGEMRSSLRTVQDWPAEFAFGRRLPKWILDAEISDGDEMEANARLIAAAPDLLEAVEMLLIGAAACAIPHPKEREVLQMAVDFAIKAKNKAKGGA